MELRCEYNKQIDAWVVIDEKDDVLSYHSNEKYAQESVKRWNCHDDLPTNRCVCNGAIDTDESGMAYCRIAVKLSNTEQHRDDLVKYLRICYRGHHLDLDGHARIVELIADK